MDIEISLQRSHQASKSVREMKAINAIKKNPKYFYSYTKSFSSLKSRIGPLLDANNKYTSSSLEMAEILTKQYKSVFSKPEINSFDSCKSKVKSRLSDLVFTIQDVIDAIDELSYNSSSGPDGVPAILLKKCKGPLSIPLL